jgi:RNA polymerase sigma-70 factor (ECF subfamily)
MEHDLTNKKGLHSADFAEIYNRNIDAVYRICFMYMKNKSDTEDMAQNTFLKLAEQIGTGMSSYFESTEHETAWLVRVAINTCKNSLKSVWNRRVSYDEWGEGEKTTAYGYNGAYTITEPDETLEKLLNLPPKLKTALYLHYYEGYSTAEIAKMMNKPEPTVRGYMHRGRKSLKKVIEQEQASSEEKEVGLYGI